MTKTKWNRSGTQLMHMCPGSALLFLLLLQWDASYAIPAYWLCTFWIWVWSALSVLYQPFADIFL